MSETLAMRIGSRLLDNTTIPTEGVFVSTCLGAHIKIWLGGPPHELTDGIYPKFTATVPMEAVGLQITATEAIVLQGFDAAEHVSSNTTQLLEQLACSRC